jgi:hypothetical protein
MPDDAPAPSALADALDELADEMNAYPNMPVSAEEIALLHRFASAVRKLTADNARLRSCPWDARAAELQDKEGAYADYVAWKEWFSANVDESLPVDTGSILDALDSCQTAYLFDAMQRLAIGDFFGKGQAHAC